MGPRSGCCPGAQRSNVRPVQGRCRAYVHVMAWLLAVPVIVAALGVLAALWITSDDYRGVHTGTPTYDARHVATGLDDPTTQILHRGVARVEDHG